MPKQITSEELCSVIGEELFQKCLEKFSGRQFYFNKKQSIFLDKKERNDFIYNACITSGYSYAAVAEMLQLTPEYVRKIYYKEIKRRHCMK